MTDTPDASTQPTEVVITREMQASPDLVYALWLNAQAMMLWFGVDGITNTACKTDPRVGGTWRMDATGPNGAFHIGGTYLALEPGRRIVMSWVHVGADGVQGNETEAEIRFDPIPEGTRVTVRHSRIRFTPQSFQMGWEQSLGRMAAQALALVQEA
ncbi:MAG: SRPBCC domain-containing protein [Pseudomonadota bacterium]